MIVEWLEQVSLDETLLIEKMKLRGAIIEKGLQVCRGLAEHADPLFALKACQVDGISDGRVRIDGVSFESALLARILNGVERVFAYVATSGPKVAAHTRQIDDMFDRYMAEGTEHFLLYAAKDALEDRLAKEMGHRNFYHVNPGSIEDWSTLEIAGIFELMDGKPYELGMELTDSGLMKPSRSVCGFFFESATPYVNCLLCQRQGCAERKAAFDEAMHADFCGNSMEGAMGESAA